MNHLRELYDRPPFRDDESGLGSAESTPVSWPVKAYRTRRVCHSRHTASLGAFLLQAMRRAKC